MQPFTMNNHHYHHHHRYGHHHHQQQQQQQHRASAGAKLAWPPALIVALLLCWPLLDSAAPTLGSLDVNLDALTRILAPPVFAPALTSRVNLSLAVRLRELGNKAKQLPSKRNATILLNGRKFDQLQTVECIDNEFYELLMKDLSLVDPKKVTDTYSSYFDDDHAKAISATVDVAQTKPTPPIVDTSAKDASASNKPQLSSFEWTSSSPKFDFNVSVADQVRRFWNETHRNYRAVQTRLDKFGITRRFAQSVSAHMARTPRLDKVLANHQLALRNHRYLLQRLEELKLMLIRGEEALVMLNNRVKKLNKAVGERELQQALCSCIGSRSGRAALSMINELFVDRHSKRIMNKPNIARAKAHKAARDAAEFCAFWYGDTLRAQAVQKSKQIKRLVLTIAMEMQKEDARNETVATEIDETEIRYGNVTIKRKKIKVVKQIVEMSSLWHPTLVKWINKTLSVHSAPQGDFLEMLAKFAPKSPTAAHRSRRWANAAYVADYLGQFASRSPFDAHDNYADVNDDSLQLQSGVILPPFAVPTTNYGSQYARYRRDADTAGGEDGEPSDEASGGSSRSGHDVGSALDDNAADKTDDAETVSELTSESSNATERAAKFRRNKGAKLIGPSPRDISLHWGLKAGRKSSTTKRPKTKFVNLPAFNTESTAKPPGQWKPVPNWGFDSWYDRTSTKRPKGWPIPKAPIEWKQLPARMLQSVQLPMPTKLVETLFPTTTEAPKSAAAPVRWLPLPLPETEFERRVTARATRCAIDGFRSLLRVAYDQNALMYHENKIRRDDKYIVAMRTSFIKQFARSWIERRDEWSRRLNGQVADSKPQQQSEGGGSSKQPAQEPKRSVDEEIDDMLEPIASAYERGVRLGYTLGKFIGDKAARQWPDPAELNTFTYDSLFVAGIGVGHSALASQKLERRIVAETVKRVAFTEANRKAFAKSLHNAYWSGANMAPQLGVLHAMRAVAKRAAREGGQVGFDAAAKAAAEFAPKAVKFFKVHKQQRELAKPYKRTVHFVAGPNDDPWHGYVGRINEVALESEINRNVSNMAVECGQKSGSVMGALMALIVVPEALETYVTFRGSLEALEDQYNEYKLGAVRGYELGESWAYINYTLEMRENLDSVKSQMEHDATSPDQAPDNSQVGAISGAASGDKINNTHTTRKPRVWAIFEPNINDKQTNVNNVFQYMVPNYGAFLVANHSRQHMLKVRALTPVDANLIEDLKQQHNDLVSDQSPLVAKVNTDVLTSIDSYAGQLTGQLHVVGRKKIVKNVKLDITDLSPLVEFVAQRLDPGFAPKLKPPASKNSKAFLKLKVVRNGTKHARGDEVSKFLNSDHYDAGDGYMCGYLGNIKVTVLPNKAKPRSELEDAATSDETHETIERKVVLTKPADEEPTVAPERVQDFGDQLVATKVATATSPAPPTTTTRPKNRSIELAVVEKTNGQVVNATSATITVATNITTTTTTTTTTGSPTVVASSGLSEDSVSLSSENTTSTDNNDTANITTTSVSKSDFEVAA